MCSEATILLIWSRVGRLTVDMGPPRAGGAGRGPAVMDGDGDGCRDGRRVADAAAARRRRPVRVDARPARSCRRSARPSPTSSATAPPRTAPGSSVRVMRPRSTSTTRVATSSTSSRFCSTISSESRWLSRRRVRIAPISSTIEGWMPSDGSSRISSQGEPTSARASARICCSPPDSVPPRRSSRRESRGNRPTTRSIALSSVSPESGVQARRRFSCAVRPGRMPRPCGT